MTDNGLWKSLSEIKQGEMFHSYPSNEKLPVLEHCISQKVMFCFPLSHLERMIWGGGMVEACLNKNLPVHMPLPSLYFHQVSFSRVQEKIEWSRVPTTQGVGPVPQRFQPFPNVPGFRPWMYTFTSTTGSVGHWQKKGTHTHTHIHRMGVYGHMWIYTRRHAQMHVQKVNV